MALSLLWAQGLIPSQGTRISQAKNKKQNTELFTSKSHESCCWLHQDDLGSILRSHRTSPNYQRSWHQSLTPTTTLNISNLLGEGPISLNRQLRITVLNDKFKMFLVFSFISPLPTSLFQDSFNDSELKSQMYAWHLSDTSDFSVQH